MNERLKELAIQVIGDYSYGDYWPFFEEELEKFAELIVRECADVALREDHDPSDCILKHFGIEQ
jgi:hypothetical protein